MSRAYEQDSTAQMLKGRKEERKRERKRGRKVYRERRVAGIGKKEVRKRGK